MAFDSLRGRTVLFGGEISQVRLRDTWVWNGSALAQIAISGPTRGFHKMAYDNLRERTVVFGGYFNGPSCLGDIWELAEPRPTACRCRTGLD
jgi:hypothetical protein